MAIIYEPNPDKFALREFIQAPVVDALTLAAIDFIAEDNKGWAYYTGVFAGRAVAATGIPGAATTLYVAGDLIDLHFFKSESSSNVRIFLNGVQYANFETYAATEIWEAFQVVLDAGVNRIEIINDGVGLSNVGGIPWMALGYAEVSGGSELVYDVENFAMANLITFQLVDGEGDRSTIPVFYEEALTVAQYTAVAAAMADVIDDVTGLVVTGAELTIGLDLSAATLKGAVTDAYDDSRGALFTFDTSGRYAYSVRVPGIRQTEMPGKEPATGAGTPGRALIDAFLTGLSDGAVTRVPLTGDGLSITAFRRGAKSSRKS